jgi:hypothetical protein
MRQVPNVVGEERAGATAFVPVRVEHKVVDDELSTTFEHVDQAHLAVIRALEFVRLVHQNNRQGTAVLIQGVTSTSDFFLLDQQRSASDQPLLARYNLL